MLRSTRSRCEKIQVTTTPAPPGIVSECRGAPTCGAVCRIYLPFPTTTRTRETNFATVALLSLQYLYHVFTENFHLYSTALPLRFFAYASTPRRLDGQFEPGDAGEDAWCAEMAKLSGTTTTARKEDPYRAPENFQGVIQRDTVCAPRRSTPNMHIQVHGSKSRTRSKHHITARSRGATYLHGPVML